MEIGLIVMSVVLLAVGVVFLCIEILMPGFGVFGILGVFMVAVSAIITIVTIPFGIYVVLIELGIITVALTICFKQAKKRRLYDKLVLNDTLQFDKKDNTNLQEYLGSEGIAKTVLKPFGSAEINGKTVDVWAENGYLDKGAKVKVVKIEGQKLVTQEIK